MIALLAQEAVPWVCAKLICADEDTTPLGKVNAPLIAVFKAYEEVAEFNEDIEVSSLVKRVDKDEDNDVKAPLIAVLTAYEPVADSIVFTLVVRAVTIALFDEVYAVKVVSDTNPLD